MNKVNIDDTIDEVISLHVTIREKTKKGFVPVKGYPLNIKKTETSCTIKEIVKYSAITRGALGKITEEVFNNFVEHLQGKQRLNKEAEKKVEQFDDLYDLLITQNGTVLRGN